jgi:hypothetical protein
VGFFLHEFRNQAQWLAALRALARGKTLLPLGLTLPLNLRFELFELYHALPCLLFLHFAIAIHGPSVREFRTSNESSISVSMGAVK